MVNRVALGSFLSQFLSEKCVAELQSDGETAPAGLPASVNPTRAVSPSISVQVCCCIMRVMRSLLGMGTVGDLVQSSVRVKVSTSRASSSRSSLLETNGDIVLFQRGRVYVV